MPPAYSSHFGRPLLLLVLLLHPLVSRAADSGASPGASQSRGVALPSHSVRDSGSSSGGCIGSVCSVGASRPSGATASSSRSASPIVIRSEVASDGSPADGPSSTSNASASARSVMRRAASSRAWCTSSATSAHAALSALDELAVGDRGSSLPKRSATRAPIARGGEEWEPLRDALDLPLPARDSTKSAGQQVTTRAWAGGWRRQARRFAASAEGSAVRAQRPAPSTGAEDSQDNSSAAADGYRHVENRRRRSIYK